MAPTITEDRPASSPIEMPPEKELSIVDRLVILAEALGESGERVSEQRLYFYAADLVDLSREQLRRAFTRALRELKFFPKISELRELAGGTVENRDEVEAQAAFQTVIRSLERNGIDAGIRHLPERTQYAVRQCGGLFQFNSRLQVRYGGDDDPGFIDNRSPVFLQKEFVAAYKSFSVHQAMLPELTEKELAALPKPGRKFLGATQPPTLCRSCGAHIEPPEPRSHASPLKPKRIPEPLTPAQIRDRREMLRQQAELLKTRMPSAA